jgi:hypothetical protein
MTGGRRLGLVIASAICVPAHKGRPMLTAIIPQNFIKSRRDTPLSLSSTGSVKWCFFIFSLLIWKVVKGYESNTAFH